VHGQTANRRFEYDTHADPLERQLCVRHLDGRVYCNSNCFFGKTVFGTVGSTLCVSSNVLALSVGGSNQLALYETKVRKILSLAGPNMIVPSKVAVLLFVVANLLCVSG